MGHITPSYIPSYGFLQVWLIFTVPSLGGKAHSAKEQYVGMVQVASVQTGRSSSQQRWKPWEGPMLWNKSKQMGSMAKVAWHDEEGGGVAAQKYTGHFTNHGARTMCCNRGYKLTNPSALLGNKSQSLAHFLCVYALSSIWLLIGKIDKSIQMRSSCSFFPNVLCSFCCPL